MKKQMKGFVMGLLVATLLMTTVFGDSILETIKVRFNSVNITVNGKKVDTPNILYKGTTYAPLRATAELLGKEVVWDQKSNTAGINDKGAVVKEQPKQPVDNSKVTVNQVPLDIKILEPNGIGTVWMEATIKNNTNKPILSYSTTVLLKDKNEKTYLSMYDTVMPGETSPKFETFGPQTENMNDIEKLVTEIRLDLGNGKYQKVEYDHKLNKYTYDEYNDR